MASVEMWEVHAHFVRHPDKDFRWWFSYFYRGVALSDGFCLLSPKEYEHFGHLSPGSEAVLEHFMNFREIHCRTQAVEARKFADSQSDKEQKCLSYSSKPPASLTSTPITLSASSDSASPSQSSEPSTESSPARSRKKRS